MLKKLFRRFCHKILAEQGPYFMAENKRYSDYHIGVGTYGRPEIIYYDAGATLKIGNYCSIAPGVKILLGGEHHTEYVTTYPFSLLLGEATYLPGYPYGKGDVVIGNDVWIGQDAMILSGTRIGDGSAIDALIGIAWWDWPASEIKKAWPLLQSPGVDRFIAQYRR